MGETSGLVRPLSVDWEKHSHVQEVRTYVRHIESACLPASRARTFVFGLQAICPLLTVLFLFRSLRRGVFVTKEVWRYTVVVAVVADFRISTSSNLSRGNKPGM